MPVVLYFSFLKQKKKYIKNDSIFAYQIYKNAFSYCFVVSCLVTTKLSLFTSDLNVEFTVNFRLLPCSKKYLSICLYVLYMFVIVIKKGHTYFICLIIPYHATYLHMFLSMFKASLILLFHSFRMNSRVEKRVSVPLLLFIDRYFFMSLFFSQTLLCIHIRFPSRLANSF